MALFSDLSKEYRTLSVVGMAKNAGKTTTLNYIIEEAFDESIVIGVTSTGRDGESTDVVTGTDKPKVYLYTGTLVSVPDSLYESASAGLEILRVTKYHTSIGAVLICRVADSGYVQIAGPVLTSENMAMCSEMMSLGAEMMLIDGAIDRRSIAVPEASDAIVLATGAVLSRDIKKVVDETAHIAGLYSLSTIDDEAVRKLFTERERITVVGNGKALELDVKTGFSASAAIDYAIDGETEYVYIPGAVTDSVISGIRATKFKNVTFVVKDPTKIFLNPFEWKTLRKKGFNIKTLKSIKIAAISVNPVSPAGYSFEHEKLLDMMEKAVPDIRIIDVKM